ncbi:MAG: hypothetical protein JWP47_2784 [Polaromonas sp.]|jgi:hypothetical protein|nr:hypothetical protein [Polaromonas sp.]
MKTIQKNTFKQSLLTLTMMCCSVTALAQERYAPSAENQEVSDSKLGLIWRRCAEGMIWKGKTCTGQASFMSHADATARAKASAAPGQEWRLPTMKELSGIVAVREAEEGKAAIDPAAFPGTPPARFWTSTTVGPGYFMFVGFVEGSAGEGARNSPGAVRLVRAAK